MVVFIFFDIIALAVNGPVASAYAGRIVSQKLCFGELNATAGVE